jgi:hypothetical protein
MEAQLARPLRTIGILAFGALIAMLAFSAASAKADTGKAVPKERGAILHADVEMSGWTAYAFEYGTTTSYTDATEWKLAKESNVREVIEGLKPSTTYHYRVHYHDEKETVIGSDKTFTTENSHNPRFEAETYPAEVFFEDTPASFTINKKPYTCTNQHLEKTELKGHYTVLTDITGTYEGCTNKETFLGFLITRPVTIEMNGCSYWMYSTAVASPPSYPGTLGLKCPSGQYLTVRLKSPSTGEDICIFKFGQQPETFPLFAHPGVTMENNYAEGTDVPGVSMDINVSTLKYKATKVKNSTLCGEEDGEASYAASFNLVGVLEEMEYVGLYLDGE